MDELYKRLGHASVFAGAWSGVLFILAAIIYVDDTDLLILSCSWDQSLDEFFQQTQDAVMDWGLIVQATGGYLKATKCFWYMMAWQWKNGEPTLCPLSQLPKYKLMIPQKNGQPVPIPMTDVTTSKETLGVFSCPASDFGAHITNKMAKGKLWVESLRRNRCDALAMLGPVFVTPLIMAILDVRLCSSYSRYCCPGQGLSKSVLQRSLSAES
jgi:hypothetical protein